MASDKRKQIFIDGKAYDTIDQVPPHLRAQVEQQLQGVDANRYEAPTARRRMGMTARGGTRGEGPSGAPLLAIAGIAFLILVGLLYLAGR